MLRSGIRSTYPGAVTSALGLFALVYGFSNAETHSWTATATIVALVASPVLLTAFVLIERRAKHPLLPVHIIWDRGRGGAYTTIALAGAGVFAVFLFLTYFLQQQLGLSPLTTGLAFLPLTGVLVVTSTTVQTRVIQHTGVKPLVIVGMTLGLIAMLLFTRLTPGSSYASSVLPGLIIMGVGMGCIFAPAFSTATLGVEGNEAGIASAMVNTSQQVGGSVGTALLSTLFASAVASYTAGHLHTTGLANAVAVHGYTTAFWWGGRNLRPRLPSGRRDPARPGPSLACPPSRLRSPASTIGNCHHFEAADGVWHRLSATTGAGGDEHRPLVCAASAWGHAFGARRAPPLRGGTASRLPRAAGGGGGCSVGGPGFVCRGPARSAPRTSRPPPPPPHPTGRLRGPPPALRDPPNNRLPAPPPPSGASPRAWLGGVAPDVAEMATTASSPLWARLNQTESAGSLARRGLPHGPWSKRSFCGATPTNSPSTVRNRTCPPMNRRRAGSD